MIKLLHSTTDEILGTNEDPEARVPGIGEHVMADGQCYVVEEVFHDWDEGDITLYGIPIIESH